MNTKLKRWFFCAFQAVTCLVLFAQTKEQPLPKTIDEFMRQPGVKTYRTIPTNTERIILPFLEPGAYTFARNQRLIASDDAPDLIRFQWSDAAQDWRVGLRLVENSGTAGTLLRIQALLQNLAPTERYYFGDGAEYPMEFFVVTPDRRAFRLDVSLSDRRASYLSLFGYKIRPNAEAYFDITFANLDWMTVPGDYVVYGVVRIPRGRAQEAAEVPSANLLLKVSAADVAAARTARRLRHTLVNTEARSNLNILPPIPERMLLGSLASQAGANNRPIPDPTDFSFPTNLHKRPSPQSAPVASSSVVATPVIQDQNVRRIVGLSLVAILLSGTLGWLLWRRRGGQSSISNG